MTFIKILFVLALAVPAAGILFFFFKKMADEFAVVKLNKNTDLDYDIDMPKRRSSGAGFGRKKTKRSERFAAEHEEETPRRRETPRSFESQKADKPKRKERKADKRTEKRTDKRAEKKRGEKKRRKYEKVDHSRDTMKLDMPVYPKDPYADFKRPDLDQVIRNANERDRANRKKL